MTRIEYIHLSSLFDNSVRAEKGGTMLHAVDFTVTARKLKVQRTYSLKADLLDIEAFAKQFTGGSTQLVLRLALRTVIIRMQSLIREAWKAAGKGLSDAKYDTMARKVIDNFAYVEARKTAAPRGKITTEARPIYASELRYLLNDEKLVDERIEFLRKSGRTVVLD